MSPLRTQRHMTKTEAHPYHGINDEGRARLDVGGTAMVWEEHDEACPLCRAVLRLGRRLADLRTPEGRARLDAKLAAYGKEKHDGTI